MPNYAILVHILRARVKYGPADLRTKPADQVCSLPVGWSAGLHYL